MEYKKLGLTNLNVSRIAFGCWAIGGYGWGLINDNDSIRAIQVAIDMGINFFDTADCYGLGHSEEILGKALGYKRNDVIIATKFGVAWDEKGNIERDCSPTYIVKALEDSLTRLKLDCISLYQIHWPDTNTHIEDTMYTLKKCQESGKIKYIGCSNFPLDLILSAQHYGRVDSIQSRYSILNREFEEDIRKSADELGMGVLVYDSLAKGLLTGKFSSESVFSNDDVRSRDENFKGEKFVKNLQLVELLKEIAAKYKKSCSQVALRWILDNTKITAAITGIKKPEQVRDNIGALNWSLSIEDQELISNCCRNILV